MRSPRLRTCLLAVLLMAAALLGARPTEVFGANGPDTTITGRPPDFSVNRAPSFSFASSDPGASFECRVDGAAFGPCTSPLQLPQLPLGAHGFAVRAVAADGQRDSTPARAGWNIVSDLKPPVVEIAGLPASGRIHLASLSRIHGTAVSAAGVKSIEVALRVWGIRRQPSLYSTTYCLFADLHRGTTKVSPCLQPLWLRVNGGSHWRLRLAREVVKRLPRVDYELRVRAINRAGEGVIVRRKLDVQG